MSTAPWHIRVFGSITVSCGDSALTAFRSQQTARLLACLACRPNRLFSREELVEMLWPKSAPTAGRNSLNVSLSSLRKTLGEHVLLPLSETGKQHLRINAEAVTTDYVLFKNLLTRVTNSSPSDTQIESYISALSLYAGELAPGLDDEWTTGERQAVIEQYLSTHYKLARLLITSKRQDEAMIYLRQAIRADPYREDIRRLILQLLCAVGRRSEALTEYSDYVDLLRSEIGMAPSQQIADLINKLLYTEQQDQKAASQHVPVSAHTRPSRRQTGLASDSKSGRSPLFGRDENVLEISGILRSSDERLISLTGIGGIGKTRLARAVSDTLADVFGSARHYVPLADVVDGRLLAQAIVRSLNIRSDARMNALAQIVGALKDTPVLLVLDNIEQLLPLAAGVVHRLLDDLPMMKCLTTTRRRLNLSDEREYPVLPLQTPSLSGVSHRLLEFPIMQLFMHRAEIVSPGFEITEQNCSDLAAICHHLEGLPLATEMAASWLRVYTPAEMLARLTPRLPLLVSREVDSLQRHSSVRHTLDCSYDQLPASHKRTFARLSVFRGGWSAAAAERVAGGAAVAGELMDLRDCSLVSAMFETQPLRLFYLDIVREYAGGKLIDSGEETAVRISHAQFCLEQVDLAQRHYTHSQSNRGVEIIDSEYRNISEALQWTLSGGSPIHGVKLAASIWRYWLQRGYIAEGIEWLDSANSLATDMPEPLRAQIKLGAGTLRITAGDYAAARQLIEDALSLVKRSDDQSSEADVQNALGNLAFVNGDWETARTRYEHALRGHILRNDSSGEARVLSNLASVAVRNGDLDTAIRQFDCALNILRTGADSHALASAMANSVSPHLAANNLDAAGKRLLQCIEISLRDGYPRALAHCFEGVATIALRRSRWSDSTVMFAVAAKIRDRINAPLPQSHRSSYDDDYACLRKQLGDAEFSRAWQIGFQMSDKVAADHCISGGQVAAAELSAISLTSR